MSVDGPATFADRDATAPRGALAIFRVYII